MTLALVGLSVIAAACVQSTTGLGFALVLSPVVFAVLSPAAAIITVTGLGLALNLLVLIGERRRPRIAWREVLPILVAVAPGAVCGVIVLRGLPKPALQLGVGIVLLSAVLLGHVRRPSVPAREDSVAARLAIGLTAGVLTTSSGISGPPIALWLSRTGLSPAEVRDSLSATFLAIGLIACVALVPVVHRAHLDPALVVPALICVAGGHALGRRAFSRVQSGRFEALLRAVIVCAGAVSVVAGAAGL